MPFTNNIFKIPHDVNFVNTLYAFIRQKYIEDNISESTQSIFIFPNKLAASFFAQYLTSKFQIYTNNNEKWNRFKIITYNDINHHIEDLLSDDDKKFYENEILDLKKSSMSEMEELLLITSVVQSITNLCDDNLFDVENTEIISYIKQNNDQNFRYILLYNIKEVYANEIPVHILKLGNLKERVLAYVMEQIENRLAEYKSTDFFKTFKIQDLFRANKLLNSTKFNNLSRKAIFPILPSSYFLHVDQFINIFLRAFDDGKNNVIGSLVVHDTSCSPYNLFEGDGDSNFLGKLLRCEILNNIKIDNQIQEFIDSQKSDKTRLSINRTHFKDNITEISNVVNFALNVFLMNKNKTICIVAQDYKQCQLIDKRLRIELKNRNENDACDAYDEIVMNCAPTTLIDYPVIKLLIEILECSKIIKQIDRDHKQDMIDLFLSIIKNPITVFYNDYSMEIAWFEEHYVTQYRYSDAQLSKILHIALENLNDENDKSIENRENKEQFLILCIEMIERMAELYEYAKIRSNFIDILKLHISILNFMLVSDIDKNQIDSLLSYGNEINSNNWLKSEFYLNEYSQILYALCYRKNQYGEFKLKPIVICTPLESRYLNFDYTIVCGLQDDVLPKSDLGNKYITEATRRISYTHNNNCYEYKTFETLEYDEAISNFISLLYSSKNILLTSSAFQNGKSSQVNTFVKILSNYDRRLKLSLFCDKDFFKCGNEGLPKVNFLHTKRINNIYFCDPQYRSQFRQFSSTSFERLMQNPYVFFLQYILKLEPCKKTSINEDLLEREFGILIHRIVHNLTQREAFKLGYESYKLLLQNVIKQSLASLKISSDLPVVIMWRYKIGQIFEELFALYNDPTFVKNSSTIESEVSFDEVIYSNNEFETKFKVIVDAIIINKAHEIITLIDYKTGALPSFADVMIGNKPQLAIESAIYSSKQAKSEFQIMTKYLQLKCQHSSSGLLNMSMMFENEVVINEIKRICELFYSEYFSFCAFDDVYEKEYMHFMRKLI